MKGRWSGYRICGVLSKYVNEKKKGVMGWQVHIDTKIIILKENREFYMHISERERTVVKLLDNEFDINNWRIIDGAKSGWKNTDLKADVDF